MNVITAEQVHAAMSYPHLVDVLQEGYAGAFKMPPRQVFLLSDEAGTHDAFALLPSWNDGLIGVKAFTYFPTNPGPKYKSLYSQILLFEREHGEPLALIDGVSVTYWRTAGISGLAARLLAREDASSLLVLGTGNLAPYIIRAQASVRPLTTIRIWGRNMAKARAVVAAMEPVLPDVAFSVVENLEKACGESDIIVAATGSHEPLVHGDWVQAGTHTDFIGNHHATKRECDTALVTKSKVYADSRDNCFREAGEILVPISEGVFRQADVVGELTEMCAGAVPLRVHADEITLFKSIGMAYSDLLGAGLVYRATQQS
ncbi:MAG: ornithine cyclodeaminase family protein [Kiritimatiellia bacterium]